MASLLLDDFTGGLNLRDSPNQLRLNETPACNDFMLTERGGLKRRPGCENVVALPGTTGKKADLFYSEVLDLWLCAREGSGPAYRLYTRPGDLSGSWTDRGTIASATSARARFADWPGSPAYCVIATDTADATNGGVYTLDSTPTLTKRHSSPKSAIAIWQNKVWVTPGPADVAAGYGTRLVFSAAGDPTTYSSFIDIRDKDGAGLTALGVVGGALVAFKKRSTYRVTDSTTGAYTTIDPGVGCVNPRAIVTLAGHAYLWAADGIYESDGIGSLKNVGDKLRPTYLSLSATDQAAISAGVFEDSVIFVNGIANLGSPDVEILQFYPRWGAFVGHDLPSGSQEEVSSFARKDATLYAAVADGDDLFSMFTGNGAASGKDDATNFGGSWSTPWLLPNSGQLARLQRVRVQGLGSTNVTATLYVGKDWDPSGPTSYDITAGLAPVGSEVQRAADVMSLGHGSAFQLTVGATGSGFNTDLSIRALHVLDTPQRYPAVGYPKKARGSGSPPPGPPPPERWPPPAP